MSLNIDLRYFSTLKTILLLWYILPKLQLYQRHYIRKFYSSCYQNGLSKIYLLAVCDPHRKIASTIPHRRLYDDLKDRLQCQCPQRSKESYWNIRIWEWLFVPCKTFRIDSVSLSNLWLSFFKLLYLLTWPEQLPFYSCKIILFALTNSRRLLLHLCFIEKVSFYRIIFQGLPLCFLRGREQGNKLRQLVSVMECI